MDAVTIIKPGQLTRQEWATRLNDQWDRIPESAKWLQYLSSSDITVQTRLNNDWELPAVADPALLAPYTSITPPDNRQAVFDSLDAVVVPPVIERQQELQDTVTLYLQKAVQGELSVKDALDQAVEEVNALLK